MSVSAPALRFRLDLDRPAEANIVSAASAGKAQALGATAAGAALNDSDNDETMQDSSSSDQQLAMAGELSQPYLALLSMIQLAPLGQTKSS